MRVLKHAVQTVNKGPEGGRIGHRAPISFASTSNDKRERENKGTSQGQGAADSLHV